MLKIELGVETKYSQLSLLSVHQANQPLCAAQQRRTENSLALFVSMSIGI